MADRPDVYWGGIWEQGSTAAWLSADLAERQVSAGLGALPKWLNRDKKAVVDGLSRKPSRDALLGAMSVLDTWRTVTGPQLAAFTGLTELSNPHSKTMGQLFAAGIADIGRFNMGLVKTADAGHVYRPSRTHNFDRFIAPHLSYPELTSVTGGFSWESGGQYDRHNILAAELALRVAEFCEIGSVTGEKLSTIDLLAHTGAGFEKPSGAQRTADATLIRTDGARIAVELTATTGRSFEKKVREWAALLALRRMADTGLVVVFVVATRPDKRVNEGEVSAKVKSVVAAAARDNPGVSFDRVADRMFVADWEDWFPEANIVAPSFSSLTCMRPSGPPSAVWEHASILDPIDTGFDAKDEQRATASIKNLACHRATPHWIRELDNKPAALWSKSVKALGFTKIPSAFPRSPETAKQHPLGLVPGQNGQPDRVTPPPRRVLLQSA